MYWREESGLLACGGDGPELKVSEPFAKLLQTFPDECPVPGPVVKLGLLTRHLHPVSEDILVDIDDADIESASTAVVLPETLAAIQHFVYHHTDHLSGEEKRRVGKLCKVAQLDLANELGASESAVRQAATQEETRDYSYLVQRKYRCEYCGDEFDSKNARNGHLGSCDENPDVGESSSKSSKKSSTQDSSSKSRPAFGKEIRKDKGSERVSGRNPFADPSRLKDTGLHQGGGS